MPVDLEQKGELERKGVFVPPSSTASVRTVVDDLASARAHDEFLLCPETKNAITFGALRSSSLAIGALLKRNGISTPVKIAMLLDNGIHTAGLFLSVMYCGHVVVPLNTSAPAKSLARVLLDSECTVAFVSDYYLKEFESAASELSWKVKAFSFCELTGLPKELSDNTFADSSCLIATSPDSDALIAYTSGSTGNPKGAVFLHQNLLIGGFNTVLAHELDTKDCSLCVLPLYHMNAQVVTLMSTLVSGGKVIVPRHFNVDAFWTQIVEYSCTWSALVPTIISQLVQRANSGILPPATAKEKLRFARSSSAPLSPTLHREFESIFDLPMIEAMGMTEAGGAIFSNPLPPAERKIGSPGLPFGFVAKVVDSDGKAVAPLEKGELYLSGGSVMKGYFKQDSLTRSVMRDNFLATGDIGWCDADGFIFIVGRTSEVITKGAEKIPPREVEEVLRQHNGVSEVAVIGVPDAHWGKEVIAFVTVKPGFDVIEQELLKLCQVHLGVIKAPKRVHFLAEFPRAAALKIDKTSLVTMAAELDKSSGSQRTSNVISGRGGAGAQTFTEVPQAPSSPFEVMIAEIWSEVLKVEVTNIHSDFFALGGTSLAATAASIKFKEAFGVDLALYDFFEHPTVNRQALLVTTLMLEADDDDSSEVED